MLLPYGVVIGFNECLWGTDSSVCHIYMFKKTLPIISPIILIILFPHPTLHLLFYRFCPFKILAGMPKSLILNPVVVTVWPVSQHPLPSTSHWQTPTVTEHPGINCCRLWLTSFHWSKRPPAPSSCFLSLPEIVWLSIWQGRLASYSEGQALEKALKFSAFEG